MNEVIKAAADLQSLCKGRGWRFCFIGGLAVLRWGEPRETVDVDLTLLTGFSGEDAFIQVLLDRYAPRIGDAVEFARTHWMDVEGVIVRQSGRLDWQYVHSQLEPLLELKEEPELLIELERRRAELER